MVYEEIINNLNDIIETNKKCEDVYNTFKFSQGVINDKQVLLKKDPERKNMLDGSTFVKPKKSNSIYIYFGSKYLDTYLKNSTLHNTILIHELKHLYDYCQNKESFFESSVKEKYFYEFEARKIEAKFIKYYLEGKYNLTKLEQLMLNSYNNDGLNNFIILFQRVDMNIYCIFKELEDDFNKNMISKEEIIKTLINGGYKVIESFKIANEQNRKFANYVSIISFRNCLEDIILENENSHIVFEDLILNEEILKSIYINLYEIIDNFETFFKRYAYSVDIDLEKNYM